MTVLPLSFGFRKLRDLRWSIVLSIVIAVGILGWLVFSSMGEVAAKSVEEYSDDLTYITIGSKHIPEGEIRRIGSPEAPEVDEILREYAIPKETIALAKEIQHVERVYTLHVFDVGVIQPENAGLIIDNLRLITMHPAVALGLGELPPFMIEMVEGRLPKPGVPEVALLSRFQSRFKVGDEVEVFVNPIRHVVIGGMEEEMHAGAQTARISGFFAFSGWSPVQLLIHKDFLDGLPMGDAVLRRAIAGDYVNTLVIKFDDVHHAEEVIREVRTLFEGYPMLYDEYLLRRTRELAELSTTFGGLLSYSSLLLSMVLFTLIGYLSLNVRRWELGLLRSLGFKAGEIRNAYMSYSIAIGAMGCAMGILLARVVQGIIPGLLGIQRYPLPFAIEPIVGVPEIGLAFILALSVSMVSISVAITLAMRRPVEEDLREF